MRAEFRLLGDVEVRAGGRLVEIGHARQRVVLVALLADVNRVVTVDQLVSRVWGEEPPQRARGTLHSYLSRLRQALARAEGGAGPGLARRPGGYVLDVDPLTVDLHRFRHLLARAKERGTEGTRAAALRQEALDLWRGDEPFAGLDTPWLATLRDSLTSERYTVQLDLTDTHLRLGHHTDLLTELSLRTTAHPLDERVAGQYVLALFRAGRRADALAHLQRVRRTLVEELGVDPGAELVALQQRVLRADGEAEGADPRVTPPANWRPDGSADGGLDGGEVRVSTLRVDTVHVANLSVADAGSPVVRPAQLPTAVPDFTGREVLAAELTDRLVAGVPVVAVAGIGGVGKTTLALYVAHRVSDRFPDGQLYVDLHGGSELAACPGVVLGTFLRALGVTESSVPTRRRNVRPSTVPCSLAAVFSSCWTTLATPPRCGPCSQGRRVARL